MEAENEKATVSSGALYKIHLIDNIIIYILK